MTRIERNDVERVAVVWMRCRGESKLRGQAFSDLGPGLTCIVAAMHADMVLLVHAVPVNRGAHELVHAETDLFVFARPLGAKSAVTRRPRLRIVDRFEQPDALHDRPESIGILAVEHQR
jgi:hypothetical protein